MKSARVGHCRRLARHQLVHLGDLRRRERARKGRGGAGGKSQRRRVFQVEVAQDAAVPAALVAKLQDVPVLQLVDHGRGVDRKPPLVAELVGQRHEQLEALVRGQQRRLPAARAAHRRHRVVHQLGHARPAQRLLEPARANEQRQFQPRLPLLDRLPGSARAQHPEHRLEKPLAAGLGPGLRRQQVVDVGMVEPDGRAAPPWAGRG